MIIDEEMKQNNHSTSTTKLSKKRRADARTHNFGITKATPISIAIDTPLSTIGLKHRAKWNSPLVLANVSENRCLC